MYSIEQYGVLTTEAQDYSGLNEAGQDSLALVDKWQPTFNYVGKLLAVNGGGSGVNLPTAGITTLQKVRVTNLDAANDVTLVSVQSGITVGVLIPAGRTVELAAGTTASLFVRTANPLTAWVSFLVQGI